MTPIVQDKRVSMGLNGDLYFSNVVAKDAHSEYKCNARCRLTQTIQQKNPFILKVHTSECSLALSDTHIQLNVGYSPLSWSCLVMTTERRKHECVLCFQRSHLMTPLTMTLT